MSSYQLSSKLQGNETDVLVIHCSDHRIQAAINEFLNHVLNLGENYAILVVPGGPQCLTLVEYLPKFSWASWRWFNFLRQAHELRRLILIAHQDCGWYEDLPFHLHSSSDPRLRQEEDLRRVRQRLMKEFPELGVDLFYAAWGATDQITVETVSP